MNVGRTSNTDVGQGRKRKGVNVVKQSAQRKRSKEKIVKSTYKIKKNNKNNERGESRLGKIRDLTVPGLKTNHEGEGPEHTPRM